MRPETSERNGAAVVLQRGFQTRQLDPGSAPADAAAIVPSDLMPFDSQRPVRSFAYGADFPSCFKPTIERTFGSGHVRGASRPRCCRYSFSFSTLANSPLRRVPS